MSYPRSIEHGIHPGHPLSEVYGSEEFQCDGCNTPGNGPRYRCHTCDFNIHEYCGRCPSTLSTFMHPQHPLVLVMGTRNSRGFCDLCGDNVEGLFYRCDLCDFDLHPLCTELPEYVPHVLHPHHLLKLYTSSPGCCRVCNTECSSWRYGCRGCGFDIHLECILARCEVSASAVEMAERSLPAAAPVLPPGWGHCGGVRTTHYGPPPSPYHHPSPHYQHPYHHPSPHYQHPYHHPSPHYQHPYHHPSPHYQHPYHHSPHFGAYVQPSPTQMPSYYVHYYYEYARPPQPPPDAAYNVHGEYPPAIQYVSGSDQTDDQVMMSGKPSKWGKRLGKIIFCLVTNIATGLLGGLIFGL